MMTNDELQKCAENFARQSLPPSALDVSVKETFAECLKAGYIKGYSSAEEEILDRLKEIITYGDKLHLQSKHIVERIINELLK